MFSAATGSELFPITGLEIVGNILVALICSLSIGWLYRRTYMGPGYSVAFVNSLVLLSMITAVVILIIGNSLARAFGLVGAMSIIRFRTAVKDTLDIVYIFFALVIGMAAGAGYYQIAVLSTLAIGAVIFMLSKRRADGTRKADYLLQFEYGQNGDGQAAYLPILQRYCRKHTVINTRAVSNGREALELSFYVDLRDRAANDEFVRELRGTRGVERVNLYFDDEVF